MTFQPTVPLLTECIVHEASNSLVLKAQDPLHIRDWVPQSRTLNHPDYNVTVKWTDQNAKLLRTLGFAAPSPQWYGKKWPGKFQPMDHQLEMIDFYLANDRCFNLSEMGSMKTAPTLWAADLLMKAGKIRRAIIISPLSTLWTVWQQEIFDTVMHRKCVVVHGSAEKRKEALAMDVDFYIINHDATGKEWIWKTLRKRKDIDLIVVDECSKGYRNARIDRYKGLRDMIRDDQRLWMLTGTPVPNWPTDAWAQAKLVSPQNVPEYFGQFKRMTMTQCTQFRWKAQSGAEKIVHAALQPAIRFKKSMVINLPPVTTIKLSATLTPSQKTAFATMKALMAADVNNKEITAVNAADKIGKLRQILCGVIKEPDTNNYMAFDYEPRMQVLRDAIESASAKVIVVCPFKGVLRDISYRLANPPKGERAYSVGMMNGDVSVPKRNKIIQAFKHEQYPEVLCVHPKVASHGLNLTEADTLIFYAPIYSNDDFEQVMERFNRKGQTRKMTIVRIAAHSLEWDIYAVIDQRRMTQETVLNLYHRVLRMAA
jgi:SNF2 family DNA or RNA helicase